MNRILELWEQASLAVYSMFALVLIQAIGLGLGVAVGTAYGVIGFRPYLFALNVRDLSFWCPYGLPTASGFDLFVWTLCAVTGWLVVTEYVGNVFFPPNSREDWFPK